jgi:predicted nucleic acid-binding protein
MKQTVYIETTVVSYLTSRPSRDLIVAAHQQITRDWWDNASSRFDLYISAVVMDEISRGDKTAAGERQNTVTGMKLLARTNGVDDLTTVYARDLPIPEHVVADCYHLAFACWHGMDYLVSWNMAHIVNGGVIRRVMDLNSSRGIRTPVICTPEELMEGT